MAKTWIGKTITVDENLIGVYWRFKWDFVTNSPPSICSPTKKRK